MAKLIANDARCVASKAGPKETPLDDPVLEARRQRKLVTNKAYYERNKDRILAQNAEWRASARANGVTRADTSWYLMGRYGITLDEYEQMFADQNGKCASCGATDDTRRLDVDHCHETGKIRSLLCRQCNAAFGLLQDSPDRVASLLAYALSHENVLMAQTGAFDG